MLLFALRKIRFLLFFNVTLHLEKEKKFHGSKWTSWLLMLPPLGKMVVLWSLFGLLRGTVVLMSRDISYGHCGHHGS